MPVFLIKAAVWGGGLLIGLAIIKETDETLDAATRLVAAGAVAGGVYVAGKALKVI